MHDNRTEPTESGSDSRQTSRATSRASFPAAAGHPGRWPKRLTAIVLAAPLLAATTLAQGTERRPADRFTVYADVIDVRPVYSEYRTREPREECWVEEQQHVVREGRASTSRDHRDRRRGNGADALVGGVIGGVIGNQLGRNSNRGARTGATVAGAIIGSVVGNEAGGGNSRHRREPRHSRHVAPRTVYETREVERCRTVETVREERRVQHYDVTYRYEGRTFTTRQPRDPGRRIKLHLSVTPAGR